MSASHDRDWVVVAGGDVIATNLDATHCGHEIADMLAEAKCQGFDMSPNTEFEELTVAELEMLIMPHGLPC